MNLKYTGLRCLPLALASLAVSLQVVAAQTITNGGFESPALATDSYLYCTSMNPAQQSAFGWAGAGGAMLQNNSAVWGLLPAPEGRQTAALFGVGALSQTVYFPTNGLYQVTWRQASRAGDVNPVWVQMDGINIQSFATANPAWTTNSCNLSISTVGSHTLGFAGTSAFQTVGLDAVELSFVPYKQWQRAELSFTAAGTYTNPVNQVNVTTRFTGPGNQVYDVPGFWDGGNTWRVRFAPPAPGGWTFSNTCNVVDAGLSPRSGSIVVDPATGTNALYQHGGFLKVSPDSHYLTYADGAPFFWLGDTWWFCPGNLTPMNSGTSTQYVTPSMFRQLADQRKAQGFSVVHMAFLGKLAGTDHFTAMNSGAMSPAYWQEVDRYLDYANEAGLVPAVALSFHHLSYYTSEQWLWLWRYFMARYGAHAITCLIAGEYQSDVTPTLEANLTKLFNIGALIKQVDPYQRALTVHPNWTGGDGRQAWSYPWYDFIMFQGGHPGDGIVPPTSNYREGWNYGKPVVEGEANYEAIWRDHVGGPVEVTPAGVRRTAYHAIQAGAFGYTYGVNGLWYPTQSSNDQQFWADFGASSPWWQALYYPGATNMTQLRACYESVAWWKLHPRPGAVIIEGGPLPDVTQPLAKSDGDIQYVVWFPLGGGQNTAATLKLVATNTSGNFTGSWFDPQTGQKTAIVATLLVTNGACSLPSRPDTNDWVLLLNAVTNNAAPTGLSATPGCRISWLQWNGLLGATNYLVKRGVNPGGPYTNFSSLGATSYADANLNNGTTYYYVVSALGAAGESPNSGEVSVVPAAAIVVGNPSFELTSTNTYSVNGWNTLPQPGAWAGGGSPFDTLNPAMGGHFPIVPAGTNCCYLAGSGSISQDLLAVASAGERITLTFAQGRASSYLGTNSSLVTVTIFVGGQSWSTNFSDAALAQGGWLTNFFPIVPTAAGKLRITLANTSGNSFVDNVRLTLPPTLSAARIGNSLALTWGLEAAGSRVLGTSNLAPPALWTPETASLQTNQQGITAILPIGSAPRFFRLIWP
jgi:hypothetical protein